MTKKLKHNIFHWVVFVVVASLFTVIVYAQASVFMIEEDQMMIDQGQPVRNFWDN